MRASALLQLFTAQHKRAVMIGDDDHGVIAGLDLECRLYPVFHGDVLVRVNPAAICGIGSPAAYLNPGGDGLWPAPEGTTCGYHYATGVWRVPPGLTGARWVAMIDHRQQARLTADIDLVNAQGIGIPLQGERLIEIRAQLDGLSIVVEEAFTYRGTITRNQRECRLAPWTLCQFDCGPGCETVFPDAGPGCVWDLYGPSDQQRRVVDGMWHVRTDGTNRFQLGVSAAVPWIEFHDPSRKLRVRRSAGELPVGHAFIDIADRAAHEIADPRGCRYSIYSDASGFMEIEAAGGMPVSLCPGVRLAVTVTTDYHCD